MTARRYAHTRPTPEPLRGDDWRNRAACLDVDPELFDPAIYDQRYGNKGADALAVCAGCSVRALCLEANLEDRWLIVGGTTPDQRAAMRRNRSRATTRPSRAKEATA